MNEKSFQRTHHHGERMQEEEGISEHEPGPGERVLEELVELLRDELDGGVTRLPAQHGDAQHELQAQPP